MASTFRGKDERDKNKRYGRVRMNDEDENNEKQSVRWEAARARNGQNEQNMLNDDKMGRTQTKMHEDADFLRMGEKFSAPQEVLVFENGQKGEWQSCKGPN